MNGKDISTFKYFDQLIHDGQKEIMLIQDIILGEGEEDKYSEGIPIDVEDIVIDGNGHTINARGQTRIFKITGKNITIKNITLKNGYSNGSGGAIGNIGSIKIIDTTLTNNRARIDGGAIYNDIFGKMDILNTKFINNYSKIDGGAIFNWGELKVKNARFEENKSKQDAGALHNGGLTHKTSIREDMMENQENIDLNNVTITIEETIFIKNTGMHSGGAILNWGLLKVKNSTLQENITQNRGGAINNQRHGTITLVDTLIIRNTAYKNGGAISNRGEIKTYNTTLNYNNAKHYGGAVYNHGTLTLRDSKLRKNISGEDGGAINNYGTMSILDTSLLENTAKYFGGSISNLGQINANNIFMEENKAADGAAITNLGYVNINNTTLKYNVAQETGGIIVNFGEINVNCTIIEGSVALGKGSVINNQGIITFTDTTIVNM